MKNLQVQQRQASGSAAAPAPKAPPAGALVLDRPIIELTEHIFVGNPSVQTDRLTPVRAYVMHGAIVIDELNIILPLAGSIIRTKKETTNG